MHFLQLTLASTALVVANSAFAAGRNSAGLQHRQRSTTGSAFPLFKHGSNGIFKRQGGLSEDVNFPSGCIEICQPYHEMSMKCIGVGKPEEESNVSQADLLKCACTNEYLAGAVACAACAPAIFVDTSGLPPRELIGMAQTQCRVLGMDTTVDLTPLDNAGGGGGSSSSNDGGKETESETGTIAAPVDNTEQQETSADAGPVSRTPLREKEEETASFTPAKPTTPAVTSPSPSPSSTGAGVALKAQHVFATVVAAGSALAYFL